MKGIKAVIASACVLLAPIAPAFGQDYITYVSGANSNTIIQNSFTCDGYTSIVYYDFGNAPGVYTQTVQTTIRQPYAWTGLTRGTRYYFRARIYSNLTGWQFTPEASMVPPVFRWVSPGSPGSCPR
jgi:hypothetical protein